jgi:hypothetical protein
MCFISSLFNGVVSAVHVMKKVRKTSSIEKCPLPVQCSSQPHNQLPRRKYLCYSPFAFPFSEEITFQRCGEGAQSVYRLGYGLDDRDFILRRGEKGIFSLRLRVKTGSGTHPTSYPVGTGCSFPGGKEGEVSI